jgi:hypothetical protein
MATPLCGKCDHRHFNFQDCAVAAKARRAPETVGPDMMNKSFSSQFNTNWGAGPAAFGNGWGGVPVNTDGREAA